MPREEVAVKVYPLEALPRRTCPYDGVVFSPVPPEETESGLPRVTLPLVSMERAEMVEVEVPDVVVVER